METVEEGKMTKDLALLVGADTPFLTTEEFLEGAQREPRRGDGWLNEPAGRNERTHTCPVVAR